MNIPLTPVNISCNTSYPPIARSVAEETVWTVILNVEHEIDTRGPHWRTAARARCRRLNGGYFMERNRLMVRRPRYIIYNIYIYYYIQCV